MLEDATNEQTAAIVALLRAGGRAWAGFVLEARTAGGASAVDPLITLEQQLGLLAYEALAAATEELNAWKQQGIRTVTLRDKDYPANLAVIASRPPLLFIKGELTSDDSRSVAVIGSRQPSAPGRAEASRVASLLSEQHFTVVSGLAAGIDSEAHRATLARGGRTLAVIGTGLDHAYPLENRALQDQIAVEGAVVSQFWPDTEPEQRTFRARNAVMAGLTLASVIVEASLRSGTRIQARHALEQGRKVVLMRPVMVNEWAHELAARSGVHVAESAEDVVAYLRA